MVGSTFFAYHNLMINRPFTLLSNESETAPIKVSVTKSARLGNYADHMLESIQSFKIQRVLVEETGSHQLKIPCLPLCLLMLKPEQAVLGLSLVRWICSVCLYNNKGL